MTLTELHECFVSYLPRMQSVAKQRFRHVDGERRDEAVQNTVCLVWKYALVLVRQGKMSDAGLLTSVLYYALRQTRSGRTIQGKDRTKDAIDYRNRGRVRFEPTDLNGLVGKKTSVLDQIVFRFDVPAFLATLKPHQRLLALDLAGNMTTSEAAEKHGVTPGAISQFRSRFKQWYDEFFAQ